MLHDAERLSDSEEVNDKNHGAAISIKIKNGDTVDALINPELLNRILTVISYDELNELVETIVDSVENPDYRPLCRR